MFMKTRSALHVTTLLALISLSVGLLSSCKKSSVPPRDPTKGFSAEIQRIVPQSIVDDLRSRGMVINEGTVPPQIDGSFRASPFELLSPYGVKDSYEKGKIIGDYVYKFYGQNAKNEISYDFTNDGSDTGTGKGAFVAGNGTSFTIFSEDSGVSRQIPYKTVAIVSGELTATGIRNFQYAFVMKEKTGDDDDETLIPVKAGRIWLDGNQLASRTSGGRLPAPAQSATTPLSMVAQH